MLIDPILASALGVGIAAIGTFIVKLIMFLLHVIKGKDEQLFKLAAESVDALRRSEHAMALLAAKVAP